MHKTFSPSTFGVVKVPYGLTITRANLQRVYPYGVPGSATAHDIAEKLAGRELKHIPQRYIRRINRLVPATTDGV